MEYTAHKIQNGFMKIITNQKITFPCLHYIGRTSKSPFKYFYKCTSKNYELFVKDGFVNHNKDEKPKIDSLNIPNEIKARKEDKPMLLSGGQLVTIVMPTYNQGEFIEEAIESLLSQTYNNFELIIVDDGCTDGTEIRCKKYIESDGRLSYHKKKNGGTGSALNEGFKHSKGKYETWFSSDNVARPNYLEELVRVLEQKKDIGFVYGDSGRLHGKKEWTYLISPKSKNYKIKFDSEYLLETCYLGIAWMWRRELREVCGEFALAPSEDFDMHLRMTEKCNVAHIIGKEVLVLWRDHKKNMTHTTTSPGGWKDHHRFVEEAKKRRANQKNLLMLENAK